MKSITNERQKEKKSYASEFCLDHRKGNSNYNYEENNYNYKATALTSTRKCTQIDIKDVSSPRTTSRVYYHPVMASANKTEQRNHSTLRSDVPLFRNQPEYTPRKNLTVCVTVRPIPQLEFKVVAT